MKISGVVKKGAGRGKLLGFPTANIDLPKNLEIEDGLYVGFVQSGNPPHPTLFSPGEGRQALIFVGANETFRESDKKAEVYILDFNQDIYGVEIEVELLKKIRGVIKFDSEEKLIEQMKDDEKQARKYFQSVAH
jgi:riboflavin kinase/FMN adenylyltransferase